MRSIASVFNGLALLGCCLGPAIAHSELEPRATATTTCSKVPTNIWQPTKGATWNIELAEPVQSPATVSAPKVWDTDLFDTPASTVKKLQSRGVKVVCYFSAGSYEEWRPDASQFAKADLGDDLDDWPGEKWLQTRSASVRKIMAARLDMAVTKGCDGVDPDNVDGYDNDTGFDLKEADAVDFVLWLANEAHARGLAIGLKNAGAIIPSVLPCVQWSVNEECTFFQECDTYAAFVKANKPVFHIEYPKGDDVNDNKNVSSSTKNKFCVDSAAAGFSTILKNMDLDAWIQTC